MWDERLTSVEANRTLMEASVRRKPLQIRGRDKRQFLYCRGI